VAALHACNRLCIAAGTKSAPGGTGDSEAEKARRQEETMGPRASIGAAPGLNWIVQLSHSLV
jgi:hypothetical protein